MLESWCIANGNHVSVRFRETCFFCSIFSPFCCFLDFVFFLGCFQSFLMHVLNRIRSRLSHFPCLSQQTPTSVCTWFAKIVCFDLNFCSHYIIEYILLAYFCLETKMKMAVVYCNNWSSGTLYMCVVSTCMLMAGCVAWQLFLWSKSWVCLMFLLASSDSFVYLTLAGNSTCKIMGIVLYSPYNNVRLENNFCSLSPVFQQHFKINCQNF